MKPATLAATIISTLIAIVHLVRLVLHVPVTVGTTSVPMAVSVVGVLLFGAIAIGLWREHRGTP